MPERILLLIAIGMGLGGIGIMSVSVAILGAVFASHAGQATTTAMVPQF